MITVRQTEVFSAWFADLRDIRARARIAVRIRRPSLGNPGDVKPVGDGVSELRVDYGPGYRIYFTARGDTFVVLLCGGDKSRQERDVRIAKMLAVSGRIEECRSRRRRGTPPGTSTTRRRSPPISKPRWRTAIRS